MTDSQKIKKIEKFTGLSTNALAKDIGLKHVQTLYDIHNGKHGISKDLLLKLSVKYLINELWLLTGEGPMLKSDSTPVAKLTGQAEGIPLLPTNAMAGVMSGDVQILEYECERYVIPVFKGADFLIPIKGSSMYPKYSSGDIVACQKLETWNFFQYGKVYVLYTNQGAIVKRIKESTKKDHLLIVSDNDRYPAFDLHRNEILSVAIVIGVIRLE